MKPISYSDLEKALHSDEDDLRHDELPQLVANVSDVKGTLLTLNNSCWDEVDVNFVDYSTEDCELVVQNKVDAMKSSKTPWTFAAKCWEIHGAFSRVSELFVYQPLLATALRAELTHFVKSKKNDLPVLCYIFCS